MGARTPLAPRALIPGEDSQVQGTLKAIKSFRESCANPSPKEVSIFITLGSEQIWCGRET